MGSWRPIPPGTSAPGGIGEIESHSQRKALMSTPVSQAADQLPDTPEEVLLAALRARDEHDHARVTALTDPESVRERFERYCDVSQPRTFEWFAQRTQIAPELLQESYDRWLKAHGSVEQTAQFRGLGVSTHAELVALGPQEYLTRSMTQDDHQLDFVRRLRKHGRAVPPELLGTPPGLEYVVLGGVHETPDLVHLLYRFVIHRGRPDESRGPVARTALRRQTDGVWRLVVEDHHFLDTDWPMRVTIVDEEYADLFTEMAEEHSRELGGAQSPPT
jgi:hypothetical protein